MYEGGEQVLTTNNLAKYFLISLCDVYDSYSISYIAVNSLVMEREGERRKEDRGESLKRREVVRRGSCERVEVAKLRMVRWKRL